MRTVLQENEYGCGIACIAMLFGISYGSAAKRCAQIFHPGDGIYREDMKALIEDPEANGKRHFHIVNEGKLTQTAGLATVARVALLWGQFLPTKGTIQRGSDGNVYNHWAVWDPKEMVVRDPYGYRKPLLLKHFYELEQA